MSTIGAQPRRAASVTIRLELIGAYPGLSRRLPESFQSSITPRNGIQAAAGSREGLSGGQTQNSPRPLIRGGVSYKKPIPPCQEGGKTSGPASLDPAPPLIMTSREAEENVAMGRRGWPAARIFLDSAR